MADYNQLQSEMQKHSADMGLNLTRVFMQNADAMMRMNISFAENTINAATKNAEAIAHAKDVNEALSLYQTMVQGILESAMQYGSSVYEANSKASTQITDALEKGISGIADQVSTAVETITSQPGSPDQVADAVKTTAASASAAINEMTKAARRMKEMADANFAAMSTATRDAIRVNGVRR